LAPSLDERTGIAEFGGLPQAQADGALAAH
jgi:hypothetical protein